MSGRRRVGAAFLAAGAVALVVSFAGGAGAVDEPQIGFFDVTAESNGVGLTFGDPSSSPYPVAAGLVPHALAQLSTGPSGRATSSLFWPGPLVANAGSLANVIGTPLPPEVVANANYPVVAQAAAGGGGSDEAALGPMRAKVDGADAQAATSLSDVAIPDVVTAGRVVTTSRSLLENGKAVAVADTEILGVDVAGVVRIGAVRTVARGTSDGTAATTKEDVSLTGVTIAGQSATIDHEGIHLGDGAVPTGEAVGGAKAALDAFGMSAFVTKPRVQRTSGGGALLDSGAVVFVFSPPDSGQVFTVVLGGSSVVLSATPAVNAADGGGSVTLPEPTASAAPSPDGSPSFDLPPDGVALGADPPTGSLGGEPAPVVPLVPVDAVPPLDLASATSDRAPLGWVLLGVLGALMFGAGLHTLRDQALGAAVAGTRCPLEGG